MKLFYLFESLNINAMRQLKLIALSLDIPEEKLINIINEIDPSNKYAEWILRQIKYKNVIVPEDNHRIKEVINQFKQYQPRLTNKDLNQYKTIHDVEAELEKFTETGSKREGAFQVNPEKLPGVKLINQDGDYKLWEVTDPESLSIMGEGTKWCTRKSYPNCQAKQYIDDQTAIYIISHENIPIIQFTPDFEQVMNRNDKSTSLNHLVKLLEPIKIELIFNLREADWEADGNAEENYMLDSAYNYINHTGERFPQAEQFIMKDANYAVEYARNILNKRWPEAEPYILKEPEWAYEYARNVIKDRWPEAEPAIMKSNISVDYATHVIGGRWPEAEPYILGNFSLLYWYIKEIINTRWRDAEPYLIKYLEEEISEASTMADLLGYSRGSHRWQTLMQSSTKYGIRAVISSYIRNYFTENDKWPEIRPFIKYLDTKGWKTRLKL